MQKLHKNLIDVNDITVDQVEIIDPNFGSRESMATAGGQIIRIRGSNFGIPGNINSLIQLYLTNEHIPFISEDASFSKLVESCQRIETLGIGNTQVDCLSPEGYGTDLRLYLKVKRCKSNIIITVSSFGFTMLMMKLPYHIYHRILLGYTLTTTKNPRWRASVPPWSELPDRKMYRLE